MILNSKFDFYEKLIFAKSYNTSDLKKNLTRTQKMQSMPPRQKTQKPMKWNADENIEMY